MNFIEYQASYTIEKNTTLTRIRELEISRDSRLRYIKLANELVLNGLVNNFYTYFNDRGFVLYHIPNQYPQNPSFTYKLTRKDIDTSYLLDAPTQEQNYLNIPGFNTNTINYAIELTRDLNKPDQEAFQQNLSLLLLEIFKSVVLNEEINHEELQQIISSIINEVFGKLDFKKS